MSQLAKLSSRLIHISNISNKSVVNKAALVEFSNLGNKGHCGYASLAQQTVIMPCPQDLQDEVGTDKYYAETDGGCITAVAATLKLLAEEKLRRETNPLQVPINQILKEARSKTLSPKMIKMILADL